MNTKLFSDKLFARGLLALCICAILGSMPLSAKEINAPVADDLPTFDSALNTLFGNANPGLMRPVAAQVQAGGGEFPQDAKMNSPMRVVVKPGDTVDALLRRHLGESVFSQKFLRQAVIRLNPAAFAQGNIHRLESGTTLLLPTEQTLLGLLAVKSSGAVSIPLGRTPQPQGDDAAAASNLAASQATHKHWVRYP